MKISIKEDSSEEDEDDIVDREAYMAAETMRGRLGAVALTKDNLIRNKMRTQKTLGGGDLA